MSANEVIVETRRLVARLNDYDGVCHACGSPITVSEPFVVIEVYKDDQSARVVPVDLLRCPHCKTPIEIIRIWFSLDVSKELRKIDA